jgi:hypothetical protein
MVLVICMLAVKVFDVVDNCTRREIPRKQTGSYVVDIMRLESWEEILIRPNLPLLSRHHSFEHPNERP